MRDDTPDTLDQVVDDAARSMTGGTPSPDLRSAVHRRIETGGTARRVFPVRLVWACAALVLLATAVFVVRDDRRADAPAVIAVSDPASVAAAPGTEPPAPPRPAFLGEPGQRRAARGIVMTVPPAEGLIAASSETTPQDPVVIEPIAIEPLALDEEALDLELMEVPTPLRAERLEIEPVAIE
jgi:hypothetical protein